MTPPEQDRWRIAFCITELDPGGAERAFVELVTRINPARFEPYVICLSAPGALVAKLKAAEIPVTCLNATGGRDIGIVFRLWRELRRIRPQLLQCYLFHANIAGRLAGRLAGVPHVLSGIRVAERRRNWYLRLDRWTQWLVDYNVCVSQAVARFSTDVGQLSPSKTVVIPNGVDVDCFSRAAPVDLSQWGIESGDQVWVTVGRLDPQKGPFDLLQSVIRLAPDYPRLRILWAGDGPLRDTFQQQIRQAGLEHAIRLIGWQADIPGLLRSAAGFVLFSRWEGMPNAVLEAAAAGLPIVATAVEGVPEILQSGRTGWYDANLEQVTQLWHTALSLTPSERAEVGRAAQADIRQRFNWQQTVEQYEQLYLKLLQG